MLCLQFSARTRVSCVDTVLITTVTLVTHLFLKIKGGGLQPPQPPLWIRQCDLYSSSPLRTASNRRCARTALEIAFPDMICSTAFGAYIISNISLIPEPAIRWPMLPRKLISMWKAPNLSIRRRVGLPSGCDSCIANDWIYANLDPADRHNSSSIVFPVSENIYVDIQFAFLRYFL